MVKVGNFYRVYGKDAYIIAYLFKYKISEENDIMVSGFPTSSIKKVEARLENKKINYIVLDRKDNYAVNERTDFKNLNTYQKHFNLSKTYVSNVRRIENINEHLLSLASKEELKILLKDIEIKNRIRNSSYDLLELAYEANTTEDDGIKISIINKCIAKAKIIDFLVNLSYEKQIINNKRYIKFGESIDEIIKYLVGWKKSIKNQ